MSDPKSHKVAIIVALIGLVGTLLAAIIGNLDKLDGIINSKKEEVPVLSNKRNDGCDKVFYKKLRYGSAYRFNQKAINSHNYMIGIKEVNHMFDETGGDFNQHDGKRGENPDFEWPKEFKEKNFIIRKKEQHTIYIAKDYYQVTAVPIKRKKDNLFIKYITHYVTSPDGKNFSEEQQVVDCINYEITWCGDGIVDNYIDADTGKEISEECDGGNQQGMKCSVECKKV